MKSTLEQSAHAKETPREEAISAVKRLGESISTLGRELGAVGDSRPSVNAAWRDLASIRTDLEEIVNRL